MARRAALARGYTPASKLEKTHVCPECPLIFPSAAKMRAHYRKKHIGVTKFR